MISDAGGQAGWGAGGAGFLSRQGDECLPCRESLLNLMFVKFVASLTEQFLVLSPPPPQTLNSSWTEDTRSCIFSDTALHLGKDGRKPLAAELDTQIEQKFREFEELVATGKNLLDKEHHLRQMVSRGTRARLHLPFFCFPNLQEFLAGEGAHGRAEEHARLDHRALAGSETAVASQEEQRGVFTRQHLFHHVPSQRGKAAGYPDMISLLFLSLKAHFLLRLRLLRWRPTRPSSRQPSPRRTG